MKNILIIFIFMSFKIYAQQIRIIDNLSKSPIPGVSITAKNQKNGVTSNIKGEVDISSFRTIDSLIIKHISYQTIKKIKSSLKNKVILLDLKTHSINNIEIKDSKNKYFVTTLDHLKITSESIITNQSNQTSDFLEKTMGVSIQNSQNGGGSPNVRGMEANRLLLVLDGISLNNTIYRSGHLQSSSTINPVFLNSAEVVFGPASVAYGSGAMSGTILFTTKNPKNDNVSQFIQQYESSSNAIFSGIITNYKFNKKLNISGISMKSYQNLKMGENRMHGFQNWGNELIITKDNVQRKTNYNQIDFFHKTLFELSPNSFLLFNLNGSSSSNINRFDKLNDIIDGKSKYKYWYYGPQKRLLKSLRLKKYNNNKLLFDEFTITGAYQNIQESRNKQKINSTILSRRTEALHVIDLKSDFLKNLNKLKINYGYDSRFQKLNSHAIRLEGNNLYYNTTRYPDGGTNVINNAMYLQANIKIKNKIAVLAGSRYNLNILKAKFNDTSTINLPFNELNVKNISLSKSLQILYIINDLLTLNGSLSNGFRNPNIDDIGKIFSKNDITVVVPNNKLSIEKSLNFEVGCELKFKKLFSAQLQLYRSRITDAIERREATIIGLDSIIYDGELMKVMMNKNIGGAIINGVNFAYKLNINNQISQNTIINLINGRTIDNLPLAHIPPLNIISSFKYIFSHQWISLNISFNGLKKIDDYDIEGVDNLEEATIIGNPSWYTINTKYKTTIDKNMSLIISINNILDAHYKTFGSGISASGRNFSVTLQTQF